MKKVVMMFVVLSAVSAVALAGGSGEQRGPEAVPELIIASSNAPESLMARMGERLEQNINESGVLRAKYIRGQALGDMQQVMEQHMQGSVDIAFDRPLWFAPFVSDFQVLSWGFTFRDRDHLRAFYASEIYQEMKDKVDDQMGITILHSVPDQARVTFSLEPIDSVEDIQGIKMRVPRIETFIELWKAMGANPTQVAWSEAFTSLRTGVVDAAESDVAGAWSQSFHQAAPYITMTNHVMMGIFVSANNETLASLSEAQREALQEAVVEALEWASSESMDTVEKTLADMKAEGAMMSEVDVEPFQQASLAGVQAMESKGVWPAGLWQAIQNVR